MPKIKISKTPIKTGIPDIHFESRRNHYKDERAPPLEGGGADKQRDFEKIYGNTAKGYFRGYLGKFGKMFPQYFPMCFPIYYKDIIKDK